MADKELLAIRKDLTGMGNIVSELAEADDEEKAYWAKIYNLRIKKVIRALDDYIDGQDDAQDTEEKVAEVLADDEEEAPAEENKPAFQL